MTAAGTGWRTISSTSQSSVASLALELAGIVWLLFYDRATQPGSKASAVQLPKRAPVEGRDDGSDNRRTSPGGGGQKRFRYRR